MNFFDKMLIYLGLNILFKKLFLYIVTFIFFLHAFCCLKVCAEIDLTKIMSLHYDNYSKLIYITARKNSSEQNFHPPLKYVKLSNPNRIYFDINNASLIGDKQQLIFENSDLKEIRIAQFETNPVNIVRVVLTFDENFDTSKIKLMQLDENIIVKIGNLSLKNDYFNTIYEDVANNKCYTNIAINSQFLQKITMPADGIIKAPDNVIDDIRRAFENADTVNSPNVTYDSTVSVDLSSKLKLRTKYFISQYISKKEGLLVSGIGQISTSKMFYLNDPERLVIDLPNTFLDKKIRNKEINICKNGSCNDTAKIGQFEYNTARIVINSENSKNYLPIYSQDSQSLYVINADKLNHTELATNISNINKAFVRKLDSKTNELIFSFTSPVAHSILRMENSLNVFLFNVQSYNEQDLINTFANTYYSRLKLSLLPKIGVKASIDINKSDIVKIEQSVDGKALKIIITKGADDVAKIEKPIRKNSTKSKIVLDAGHGGSDYGAIKDGINEKDITLDITQRVDAILRSKGYKVALVRNEDVYVSLEDRVTFTEEEEPEVFVSIHVNSAVSSEPSGIETHWYHDYNKGLAECIHKNMAKQIPSSNDRGLFKSKFYVINHTTVPAVLCEIGFLSNQAERNELITESRKQKTAKAIAEGIIEYLKGRK